MTVSSITSRADFQGNGSTTVFAVPFYFLDQEHLQVITTDTSTTPSTVRTLGLITDYSVAGVKNEDGGSITLATPPSATTLVTILRDVPNVQVTHYIENDPFPSSSHEEALDSLTMQTQQLSEQAGRTLRFPETGSATLPSVSDRANMLLGFDSAGLPIATAGLDPALLAAAIDASLPAAIATATFTAAGTGAVARLLTDKIGDTICVKDFGATGNGTTDDTAAIAKARAHLTSGGCLYFPAGTYIIGLDTALLINVDGVTLRGDGPVTVLKAKNGAAMSAIVTAAADHFTMRELVLDGNRAGGGINPANYGCFIGGSHARIDNVEMRGAPGVGFFVGSSVATPKNISFEGCWIHDNGGITIPGRAFGAALTGADGIGVGIQSGGAFLPDDVRIHNCRFEQNYNTVTRPGDSTGINMTAQHVTVTDCFFKNNFNVSGGQIALASDTTHGSADGIFVVSGNKFVLTTTFGSDLTAGVEINGRKFVVTNNIVIDASAAGVRVESSAGDGVVSGNVITCAGVGVDLISSGGFGIYRALIDGNHILRADGAAIQVQSGSGEANVIVQNNYIDPGIITKILGEAVPALIRGNYLYRPPALTGLVAGASPYVWPALNYDAVYSCSAAGGMFSANVEGVNVSIAVGIPIPVRAGQVFTTYWTTTAPTFGIYAQQ